MKLIATRSFRNVPGAFHINVKGDTHEHQIDMGQRFEIGQAEKLEDLSEREKLLVGSLYHAHCIDVPTEDVVERIEAEIAQTAQRELNAAKINAAAHLRHANGLVVQLAESLLKLQPAKAK